MLLFYYLPFLFSLLALSFKTHIYKLCGNSKSCNLDISTYLIHFQHGKKNLILLSLFLSVYTNLISSGISLLKCEMFMSRLDNTGRLHFHPMLATLSSHSVLVRKALDLQVQWNVIWYNAPCFNCHQSFCHPSIGFWCRRVRANALQCHELFDVGVSHTSEFAVK